MGRGNGDVEVEAEDHRHLVGVAALLSLSVILALTAVVARTGRSPHTAAAVVAVAACAAGLALWTGGTFSVRAIGRRVRRPWAAPSALIAGYLAASAVTVAAALPDVHPFSRYPMYSQPRVGTYALEDVAFVVTLRDGTTRQLPRPGSRQVVLSLVSDGDLDALERLARDLVAGREHIVEVTVEHRTVEVARYPAAPGITVVDAATLTTLDLP